MGLNADATGVAFNWIQPTGVNRDESNVEVFCRLPLLPEMDATVSYQAIINPANDPSNDLGSAISLRLFGYSFFHLLRLCFSRRTF